jgi:hypothetical protein
VAHVADDMELACLPALVYAPGSVQRAADVATVNEYTGYSVQHPDVSDELVVFERSVDPRWSSPGRHEPRHTVWVSLGVRESQRRDPREDQHCPLIHLVRLTQLFNVLDEVGGGVGAEVRIRIAG